MGTREQALAEVQSLLDAAKRVTYAAEDVQVALRRPTADLLDAVDAMRRCRGDAGAVEVRHLRVLDLLLTLKAKE